MRTLLACLPSFVLLFLLTSARPLSKPAQTVLSAPLSAQNRTKVLILGGGVAGVTAARTLYKEGITDFVVVEARSELGGRMTSRTFGAPGRQYTIEVGANWIQGTQSENGIENPILALARKHDVEIGESNYFNSISKPMYSISSTCGE